MTLKTNFISRETFLDTLISCHFAVSFICYCRDFFPEMECHLNQAGTDCCETYFSTMGQWVGNKHNYTFGDMRRNQSHCIRLREIRSVDNGINFPKPHPKGESIWYKQYDKSTSEANLKEYPEKGDELSAWKEGIVEGRRLAANLGMKPENVNLELVPPYATSIPGLFPAFFYKSDGRAKRPGKKGCRMHIVSKKMVKI